MPLDTEVDKQPSTMRTAADWMSQAATAVDGAFGTINGSRGDSETAWPRGAGESFREMTGKAGTGVQETSSGFADFAGALRGFADEIDTLKRRMVQARELACSAGLEIHGFLIMEPGPEPPAPAPLPSDKPATSEQQETHAAGVGAQEAFAKKVRAYADCAELVAQARDTEHSAVTTLNRFLSGLFEKLPFNGTDVLTGLAGAHAGHTARMRAKATRIMSSGSIEVSERLMHNPNMSLKGQTKAAMIHIERTQELRAVEQKAISSRVAGWVDRLSPKTKSLLQASVTRPPTGNTSGLLRGARSVGSKFPGLGLVITTGGVAYDVSTGKDPGTSVASNYGGYAVGAGVTMGALAMGTPIGWAVFGGAAVGWGLASRSKNGETTHSTSPRMSVAG